MNEEISDAAQKLKEETELLLNLQELMKVKDNKMVLYSNSNSKDGDLCMIIGALSGHNIEEESVEKGSIIEQ